AVGGIVGRLSCVARVERTSVGSGVSVTGTGSSVGGAIGDAGPGLCAGIVEFAPGIVDVSSAASVSGASDVGGLIGRDETVDVTRSAATGAVTATTGDAGGLVGRIAGGTLTDSYALGAVTAAGSAGGLVGAVFSDSSHVLTLTRTYAAGHVAAGGGMKSGGLWSGATLDCITDVGISVCAVSPWDPVVTGSFWDTQSTGIPTGPLGTGKSTADMQAIGTFSAAGWTIASGWSADAGRVWGICPIVNGGRPFLVSQYTASACPTAPGAPGSVKVVPGDGRITVRWTTPASDGGAPITSYTATAAIQPRGAKTALMCSAAPPTTRCVITGLRNGRAYRISVTAANVVGSGSVALAATTATPRRTLTVLSMKADGGAIFTRVRIGQGGVLTQVGRRSGAHAVACRATAVRPTRAGVVTLRCALTGAALDAIARAPLSLTIVTRLAPKSGPVASATRRVAIARLKTAEPVVG
ncbi:MAG: fibronectin type III domain-containing protein, partial [Gaiellales bacterium]